MHWARIIRKEKNNREKSGVINPLAFQASELTTLARGFVSDLVLFLPFSFFSFGPVTYLDEFSCFFPPLFTFDLI